MPGFFGKTGSTRNTVRNRRRSRARRLSLEPLESRELLASFQGLGEANLTAVAVSADGSTVVGNGLSTTPFYWTQATGVVHILTSYSGGSLSGPTVSGVSGNGSVIIGSLPASTGGPRQAFKLSGGTVTPLTSPTSSLTEADGISQDGSTIAGDAVTRGYESGFKLVGSGTPQLVPPEGNPAVYLASTTAVSADGSAVVGAYNAATSGPGGSPYEFKNNTFTPITDNGAFSGGALAVSSDGSTVVGERNYTGTTKAFAWSNGTATDLSMPSGINDSTATGVTSDGSTIVGYFSATPSVFNNINGTAFIWSQAGGEQDLKQYLIENEGLGAALTGWTLNEATAITPDGSTIVGIGIDPQGHDESWIVSLKGSTTPTPSITLTSSPNPSTLNQPVTFTATVTDDMSGQTTPTGEVTFENFGFMIGTAPLDDSGVATFTTSELSLGDHLISAVYDGIRSGVLTQTVTNAKVNTNTKLESSVNPSESGQVVTFTATVAAVSASSGTLAGSIQFIINGTDYLDPVLLNNGAASIVDPSLINGNSPYTVTAAFMDSTGKFNNSSGSIVQVVNSTNQSIVTINPTPGDSATSNLAGFSYTIAGSPLSEVVTIVAYWATGPSLNDAISNLIPMNVYEIPAGTEANPDNPSFILLNRANLGTPPPTGKYLLLIAKSAADSDNIELSDDPIAFNWEFDPQTFLTAFAQSLPASPNPRLSDQAISKAILSRANHSKNAAERKLYLNLRKTFINYYTAKYASERQVGITQLLINMEDDASLSDVRWAAYMLATAYHETGKLLSPNEEDPGVLRTVWPKGSVYPEAVPNLGYFKQYAGRNGNAKWPLPHPTPDAVTYRGRGYIHLTFKNGYAYYGYAANPADVLDPNVAYTIMSRWMIDGNNPSNALPLENFIYDDVADYFDARRIINGDKNIVAKGNTLSNGQLIAGYAQAFDSILNKSLDYVPYYP